ncbi:phage tail protein [Methylocystis heyeri]|uniref:Phage tail fibre protein N-terminal domain-containing protein n=1 Tax=Methylocystis heyeri TaxID=391905 RepID=A0A6B8KGI4_9HYPH|nr:phage tail protein [Methylocystis heyeri]QGM46742.1 hypothetical protein H2LOC_014145 [Methylocystis heyeri]
MTTLYATEVTQAFLNRQAAIDASGSSPNPLPPFNFVGGTLAVGDGNGAVPMLSTLVAQNGLTHQVWSGQTITGVNQDDQAANQIDIQCVIPDVVNGVEVGGFTIREFAIWDEQGNLCVLGITNIEKTTSQQGQINTVMFVAAIVVSNTANVVITPPSANFVTMVEVENAFNANLPTAAAPLTQTDTQTPTGWIRRVFGLRPASQPAAPAQGQPVVDGGNTGYGRPATDAEFVAGASLGGFALPWPTLAQVRAGFTALVYGSGNAVTVKGDRSINMDYSTLGAGAAQLSDLVALMRPGNPASYLTSTLANLLSLKTSFLGVQGFWSSGTYTPNANAKFCWVILTGPGGPGGASSGASNLVGGGGEAGCTVWKFFDPRATGPLAVTLAAATAPSPAGASPNSQAAAPSLSSVGSIAVAPGGQAGLNSVGYGGAPPPTDISVAVGDVILPGNPGEGRQGDNYDYRAGNGGASFWGGAGVGADGQSPWAPGYAPGGAGRGFGSGGGGGDSGGYGGQAQQGGAGGRAAALIFEFG